jgi:hypothetical protein
MRNAECGISVSGLSPKKEAKAGAAIPHSTLPVPHLIRPFSFRIRHSEFRILPVSLHFAFRMG